MSHGKDQAAVQYACLLIMVEEMAQEHSSHAVDSIREDALSVLVRSGWTEPGKPFEAEEYEILLCTGGPAVRIIGTLDAHKEPRSALLQFQDWFTPWEEYMEADENILIRYASCFWYGE